MSLPDQTSLAASWRERRSVAVLALLAAFLLGAKPKDPKATAALLKAAQAGSLAEVEAALKGGADVNAVDAGGNTALALAAGAGSEAVVSRLSVAGAEVDRPNGAGLTPLMRAAQEGRLEVIRTLLGKGVDVTRQDGRGRNALILGARSGNVAVVEALLGAGADVKALDEDGASALHAAAAEGHVEVAKALLAAKGDPTVRNANGETPYEVAEQSGHDGVAGLLKPAGVRGAAKAAATASPRAAGRRADRQADGRASAPAPTAPSSQGANTASGTLTVNGSTVKLTHAALIADTGSPPAVLLVLSDRAVPPSALKSHFELRRLTEDGSLHVVKIRITTEDKKAGSMEMYHSGLGGGHTGVVGAGDFTATSFTPTRVEGKIGMAQPREVPEGTYQYTASFVASTPDAAPAAAASRAAVTVAAGKADGTFTLDGKAVRLSHAYAWVDRKDERQPVVILISDQPVPSAALADEFALMRMAQSGKLCAVGLWFGKDKQVFRGEIHHPSFGGPVSAVGMHSFEPSTFDASTIAGRLSTARPQEFMDHAWEYSLEFNAAIRR